MDFFSHWSQISLAVSNRQNIPLLDPGDAGDVLLLYLLLTQLEDGPVLSVPDVNARTQSHGHVIQARPVHQVQVEVVEHVRGVQYLLGSRGHLAAVDGLGGRRFPGRVKNLHVVEMTFTRSRSFSFERENSRIILQTRIKIFLHLFLPLNILGSLVVRAVIVRGDERVLGELHVSRASVRDEPVWALTLPLTVRRACDLLEAAPCRGFRSFGRRLAFLRTSHEGRGEA